MKWILLKDLQILRRSPGQLGMLLVYPVLLALLVGFALTRGPDQSTVALYNAIPAGSELGIDGARLGDRELRDQFCERIKCVDATSEEQARNLVEDGTADAAVILPEKLVSQIRSLGTIAPQQPRVTIVVNGSDTVANQVVDDRIDAMLAEANLNIARQLAAGAVRYLDLLGKGGTIDLLGKQADVLGLGKAAELLRQARAEMPPGKARDGLDEARKFSFLVGKNLKLASPMLQAIAQPVEADKVEVGGRAASLGTFAVAATAITTLMFVTVLLVAGSLALEREENAFSRLTAGLVSRGRLLLAKLGLGTVTGLGVVLLLLAVMTLFLPIRWSRAAAWLPAVVIAALAFAAVGAALGGLVREVRAASLATILVCLPLALLSLVPAAAVGAAIGTLIDGITALFPFRAAVDGLSSGLEASGSGPWLHLLHLLVLTAAWGGLARLALRRF